jgi:16S rRNA (cytosine967-C5)-methyltransferase
MNARELALGVVRDVFARDRRQRGAHESFDYHASRSSLDVRDRAFAAELAYGSIKARRYLDWLLAPLLGARAAKLPPTIAEVLRLGAYQLTRMSVAHHAAVSETVGLAKRHGHRGTAGLVNAVLRRIADLDAQSREPRREQFESEDDFLGTLFSFPSWIVARARTVFGDDMLGTILAGMNEPPQAALRVNLLRATPGGVLEILRARGNDVRASELVREIILAPSADGLLDAELRWEQQGEIAAVPVDLLDPQPSEQGAELCSGRGNKTLEIVGRMQDRGLLEAVENDTRKIAVARARLEQLGIKSVRIYQADAAQITNGALAESSFVLVDAPCSGLGILGRQPEARWRKDPSDAERLAPLQRALLDAGARRVREGGRLAYSVCTFEPLEAEHQIEGFLRDNSGFARAELPERYNAWKLSSGDLRFPPGIERRDGFFISLLERRAA